MRNVYTFALALLLGSTASACGPNAAKPKGGAGDAAVATAPDTGADVGGDVGGDAGNAVETGTAPDGEVDSGGDAGADADVDDALDAAPDADADATTDLGADAAPEVAAETTLDVAPDDAPDAAVDAEVAAVPDAGADAEPDAEIAATPDAEVDVGGDASGDGQADATQDIVLDAALDAVADASTDAAADTAADTAPDVALDGAADASPSASPPTVQASAAAAVTLGAPLTVTIAIADADGDLAKVALVRTSALGTAAETHGAAELGFGGKGGTVKLQLPTVGLLPGTLSLAVTAHDAAKGASATAKVEATVLAGPASAAAPTVVKIKALQPKVQRPAGQLDALWPELSVEVSDADGDVERAVVRLVEPGGGEHKKLLWASQFGVGKGAKSSTGKLSPLRVGANTKLGGWTIGLTVYDAGGKASAEATTTVEVAATAGAAGPAVSAVQPPKGDPGATVTLIGSGYDPSAPGSNVVTLGGSPCEVVAVKAESIELVVPPNAQSGHFTVTTPLGRAVSPPFAVPKQLRLTLEHDTVAAGGKLQARATAHSLGSDAVVWTVDGVVGGDASVGSISAAGLYQAPTTPPAAGKVALSATSTVDKTVFAVAMVTIHPVPLPAGQNLVGATGGTVAGDGDAAIVVPKGALTQTTKLTAAPLLVLPKPAAGRDVLGAASFGPDGATFAQKVTITIPLRRDLPPGSTLVLRQYLPASATYAVGTGVATVGASGTVATAQVDHFSVWVVDLAAATALPPLAVKLLAVQPTELLEGTTTVATLQATNLTQDLRLVALRDGQPTTDLRLGALFTRGDTAAARLEVGVLTDLSKGDKRKYTLALRNAAGSSLASADVEVGGLDEWLVPAGQTQTIASFEHGTYSAIEIDGTVDARAVGLRAIATHHVRVSGLVRGEGSDGQPGSGSSAGSAGGPGAGAGGGGRLPGPFGPDGIGHPGTPCAGPQAGCQQSGYGQPGALGGPAGEDADLLSELVNFVSNLLSCIGGSVVSCGQAIINLVEGVAEVMTVTDGGTQGRAGMGGLAGGGGGGGGGGGYVLLVAVEADGGGGGGGGTSGRSLWLETRGDLVLDGEVRNHGGNGGNGANGLQQDAAGGGGGGGGAMGAIRLHAGGMLRQGAAARLAVGPGKGGRGGTMTYVDQDTGKGYGVIFYDGRGGEGAGAVRSIAHSEPNAGHIGLIDARTLDHGPRLGTLVQVVVRGLMPGGIGEHAVQVVGDTPAKTAIAKAKFVDKVGYVANVVLFPGRNTVRAGLYSDTFNFSAGADAMHNKHVYAFGIDSDGDQLDDDSEKVLGTDPTKADSDGDGLADGVEIGFGTDPTKADSDGDGLTDSHELTLGTDPNKADTDGDFHNDGVEVVLGGAPLVKTMGPKKPGVGTVFAAVGGKLAVLDPQSGVFGVVGAPNGGLGFAPLFDPMAKLFAVAVGDLLALDPTTALGSKVGALGSPDGKAALSTAATYDPASGLIYAVEMGPGPLFAPTGQLLSIDPATGQATRVGPAGAKALHALAADGKGKLYATVAEADGKGDRLALLDKQTGALTQTLGPLGANNVYGLTFRLDGSLLGAAVLGNAGQQGQVMVIDPATAAVTVGATVHGSLRGITTLPSLVSDIAKCKSPPPGKDCNANGLSDACDVEPALEVLLRANDGGSVFRLVDFDGDGDPDVLTSATGGWRLYRNEGGGQFASGKVIDAALFKTVDVWAADLDGDKDADLVVLEGKAATAKIYLQTKADVFGLAATLSTAANPVALAFGDINGDGTTDLVALCKGLSGAFGFKDPQLQPIVTNKSVQGLSWQPQQAGAPLAPSQLPTRIDLVDLDGKSGPDLIFGTTVFFNNGTGFAFDTPKPAPGFQLGLCNDDTHPDLLASDKCWLGDGKGVFATSKAHPATGMLQFVDWDGDGDADIVSGGMQYSGTQTASLWVNDGKGAFSLRKAEVALYGDFGPFLHAAADFDGDGRGDAVFSSSGSDNNVPGGFFTGVTVLRSKGFGGMTDGNGDGKPDSCN